MDLNWLTAPPIAFIAYGLGCISCYGFMMRTIVSNLKKLHQSHIEVLKQKSDSEIDLMGKQFEQAIIFNNQQKEILQDQINTLQQRVNKLELIIFEKDKRGKNENSEH